MIKEHQPQNWLEWFKLVEEHKNSGLSQANFCREHELSASRLSYYHQLYYKKNDQSNNKASFTPVVVAETIRPSSNEVKLEMPNRFKCYFQSHILSEQLKKLLSVVLSC